MNTSGTPFFLQLLYYKINTSYLPTVCGQCLCLRSFLEKWLDNPKFNDSLKNSIKSKETRLAANEEFKMNRLELCCKLYTKSAQFAPYKSIESALAFSNRSAIYLRLNKYQVWIFRYSMLKRKYCINTIICYSRSV